MEVLNLAALQNHIIKKMFYGVWSDALSKRTSAKLDWMYWEKFGLE